MSLNDKIKMIPKESHLKQKELAKELGITESYTLALLNGRNTNISQALATLIEEEYGYSSNWILTRAEPKLRVPRRNRTLSDIHKKAILKIGWLQPEQVKAVLALLSFLNSDGGSKQQC